MPDSFPMPGAWNSSWESPVATTQSRSDSNQADVAGAPPPRPPVREAPLPTNVSSPPSLRAVPVPTTQVTSPRTWDNNYNPFGFPRDPAAEVPEDAPEVTGPSSLGYSLFADNSDTEGNADIAGENKPPIVIAVFGQTGTGKTSFVKAVTGKDLQIGHSLTSCENRHLDLEQRHSEAD